MSWWCAYRGPTQWCFRWRHPSRSPSHSRRCRRGRGRSSYRRRRRRRVSRPRVHVRGPGGSRRQHNESGRSKEELLHHKSPVFGSVAAALTFPRQRLEPPLRRCLDSACACPFLAGPLEISRDRSATVVGKVTLRGTQVGRGNTFLLGHAAMSLTAPCHFTSGAARPRCCPNAPATGRP